MFEGLKQGRVLERLCQGGLYQTARLEAGRSRRPCFRTLLASVWGPSIASVDIALPGCCELVPLNSVPGVHGSAYISSMQDKWPL